MHILRVAIFAALAACPATAQMSHDGHSAPGAGASPFAEINAKMHESMQIEPTGDPDVDFVLSMIPHHQGAIEMARIELEKGDDPEARKLAEEVIAAQEAEIAWMRAWLEKQGVEPPAAAAGDKTPAQ